METDSLPGTEYLDPVNQGPRSVKTAVHNGPPFFFAFNPAPLSAYFSIYLAERGKPQPSIFAFETDPAIVSKRYDWFILSREVCRVWPFFRPNGVTENDRKSY
jgi:hypothetical protein